MPSASRAAEARSSKRWADKVNRIFAKVDHTTRGEGVRVLKPASSADTPRRGQPEERVKEQDDASKWSCATRT